MNDKLIKTIVLGNGLILEIYDYSKKVAGDRWLVKMVAKVDISIDYLADFARESSKLNLQVGELKKNFDTCVRYEHQRERNFISDKEKDEVFNDLLTSYLESTQAYLSHPDFPIRCVVREYSKKKSNKAHGILKEMVYRKGVREIITKRKANQKWKMSTGHLI